MDDVVIYTDGAADPNPGFGGWAALLRAGRHERILTGSAPHTTNNRMELTAAVAALEALKRPCVVDLYTDSAYLQQGITAWIDKWVARGWVHKGGRAIPNLDLWQKLWELNQRHQVTWHWVRGHAGNPLNERVDQLACEARLAITPGRTVAEDVPRLYLRAVCRGNPGPGGWGVVLVRPGQAVLHASGHDPSSTNNRLELQAAIEALRLVPPEEEAQLITVSDYLYQGATRWLPDWRRRGWRRKDGQPIAHADLWQQLDLLTAGRSLNWVNAKGETSPALETAAHLAAQAAPG